MTVSVLKYSRQTFMSNNGICLYFSEITSINITPAAKSRRSVTCQFSWQLSGKLNVFFLSFFQRLMHLILKFLINVFVVKKLIFCFTWLFKIVKNLNTWLNKVTYYISIDYLFYVCARTCLLHCVYIHITALYCILHM